MKAASRTVYFSGFPAQVDLGGPPPAADAAAQLAAALDNVEAALRAAEMTLADVVRLNLYTTDLEGVMAAHHLLDERLTSAGAKVTGCLLGVAKLAAPNLLVEIEVTAAQ